MASNVNPTVRRRRLGQELRRLREQKGMTAEEVADRLLVSQSKISRLENGRRSISQRDVRDLCGVYEVEDQPHRRLPDADGKESRQQGWWHAFGDVPYSVYIGLETDAASPARLRLPGRAGPVADPRLRGGRHRGRAARGRRPSRSRSGSRSGCAARSASPTASAPLRLWAVLDESALRRVVGSRHVDARAAGVPRRDGPSCRMSRSRSCRSRWARIRASTASSRSWSSRTRRLQRRLHRGCHERPLSGEAARRAEYSVMYEHLRAQALNADQTRQFIADIAKEYAR